jgi:hypothetical protein
MSDDATPAKVRLTDGLGPLPERRVRHVYNEAKGYVCDAWTEEAVRAYALGEVRRAVAAERERWTEAVMAELDGNGQARAIVAYATRA